MCIYVYFILQLSGTSLKSSETTTRPHSPISTSPDTLSGKCLWTCPSILFSSPCCAKTIRSCIEKWEKRRVGSGLALSCSRGNFQTNFCHLKAIIVSQYRYSVGGLWKNLGNFHAMWWTQTSQLVLCRHSKYCKKLSRYLKRFNIKFRFLSSSQISRRMYNVLYSTVVLIKCMTWKVYRSPTLCRHLQTIIDANDINRARWVALGLLQDGACTDFFENLSENSLRGDLSNATPFNPPFFSLVDTFKVNKKLSYIGPAHTGFLTVQSIARD